jgi:type III secretion system YscD/HrpQ family protein
VFGEEHDDADALAEIDFGVIETGRWLLKVIGGPNSGAEFYMQAGNSYVIGTDPQSCDIVFHDTSVSRQHARITITPEESLLIEDLKSRNGVLINGSLIEERQELPQSTIVTLGTTSFVVYDREGEMQTIISPLLPSIVKVLQQEPAKTEAPPEPAPVKESVPEPVKEAPAPLPKAEVPPPKPPRQFGPYIVLSAIIGLFVLAGIGTSTLFHEEPVVMQTQENANELIQQALNSFPSVRWTFNKSNGSLLLLGHVATGAEKSRLMYKLGDLKFIKNIDDSGIIIDEGVLSEVNSLSAHNPEWKGIRVYSPEAGQFILSGELKTRKQAEQLSSYLSLNFPYLDLLKKQVVVEEDVIAQTQSWLRADQMPDVTVKMSNGEVILAGSYPQEKANELSDILNKIREIPGVRAAYNQAQTQTAETGIIDISAHYPVTGKSRLGNKFTVVINGRILSEGDDLDGMTITKITANQVLLQKDRDKYRIDY